MDDMSGSANTVITGLVQNTRPGASVWTTFRWLGNTVYAVGWVCALPVELVLNRRMGRRYTGLLPVTLSLIWMVLVIGIAGRLLGGFGQSTALGAGVSTGVVIAIVLLAVLRHRFANWWRFRSADQVHSFSNGIPFWLCPPRVLLRALPEPGTARPPSPLAAGAPMTTVSAALHAAASELTTRLAAEAARAASEWRRGQVPTGAAVWIAATVLHPLLLLGVGLLVTLANVALGAYLMAAAVAVFLKARVVKAGVVESVYDMFDGRIEQEFKRSIAEPVSLDAVERAGLAVPGIARIVQDAGPRSGSAGLPPELSALVTPDGTTSPNVEPKSAVPTDARP